MPPSQRLLASNLRGHICRSCLLKLQAQAPLRQNPHPQRLLSKVSTRNSSWWSFFSDDEKPNKSTKPKPKHGPGPIPVPGSTKGSTIQFWEQTKDGKRTPVEFDDEEVNLVDLDPYEPHEDDEPYMKLFKERIKELKEESGIPEEHLSQHFDLERMLDDCMAELDPELANADPNELLEVAEQFEADMERIAKGKIKIPTDADFAMLQKLARGEVSDTDILVGLRKSHLNLESQPTSKALSRPTHEATKPTPLEPGDPLVKALKDAIKGRPVRTIIPNYRRGTIAKTVMEKPNVWKTYLKCRTSPDALAKIQPETWAELWEKWTEENTESGKPFVINPDLYERILALGDDMTKLSRPLSPRHVLLYIEAMFVESQREKAFHFWEETAALRFHEDKAVVRDYWKLGVEMYCRAGQPDRALEVAEVILMDSEDPLDFRILLPIMGAYLLSGRQAAQRAWALYIRLRINMGPHLTMDDYDMVSAMFLECHQTDLALGVFKDMMLTGTPSATLEDSTAQYRELVTTNGLDSIKIAAKELDWQNSRTLSHLPVRFSNKYFYGSWIRKLIFEGHLDAAKMVFDLMQERGIRPDARHMNGLIGAWYRRGTEKARQKADDLAWLMIKERLDFVRNRRMFAELKSPVRTIELPGKPGYKQVTRLPLATIETFAVLLEQYRKREKHDRIFELLTTLREAEIAPNTSFLNELLLLNMTNRQPRWAWDTYLRFTQQEGVKPDFDTYEILWDIMRKAVDPAVLVEHRPEFGTCRTLFKDMMYHLPTLTRRHFMRRELYDLIILCFSLAEDQPGSAVALHALRQHFHANPNPLTARVIVYQLARLGMVPQPRTNNKRFQPGKPITKQRITTVAKILKTIRDDRNKALEEMGIIYEQLPMDAKLEETVMVLSDLLRYAVNVRGEADRDGDRGASLAVRAAEKMGVPHILPWE